jgi:hypothetical protein
MTVRLSEMARHARVTESVLFSERQGRSRGEGVIAATWLSRWDVLFQFGEKVGHSLPIRRTDCDEPHA